MTSDLDSDKINYKRISPGPLNETKTFFKRVHIPKKRKSRKREKNDDDVTRKKIETARARLDKSESMLNVTSIKTGKSYNRENDLPIIYFVVASDKMPILAHELKNQSQRMHQLSYTDRAKKTFYSNQTHYKRRMSEEKKRIRALGADMGLRLEPIKSKIITPNELKPYGSRLHTTPVSVSEKSDYNDTLDFKQNDACEETSENPKLPESNNGIDTSAQTLELPVIANLEQTLTEPEGSTNDPPLSPEGSVSTPKKVHFAEGLPEITGNRIDLVRIETESEIGRDVQRLKKSGCANTFKTQYLLTPESSNLSRSMSELTPRSRFGRSLKPMCLPKIDVMTPIYDELLLKTLQTYYMGTNGPKSECDANVLMQKMSAILHPEWEHTQLDTMSYRLPVNQQLVETSSDFLTKTESSKCELELPESIEEKDDVFLSTMSVERKTSLGQTDEKSVTIQTPVSSSCFQMIPPGLTKEKSQNFQTLIVQAKDI